MRDVRVSIAESISIREAEAARRMNQSRNGGGIEPLGEPEQADDSDELYDQMAEAADDTDELYDQLAEAEQADDSDELYDQLAEPEQADDTDGCTTSWPNGAGGRPDQVYDQLAESESASDTQQIPAENPQGDVSAPPTSISRR